jgi:hypothetical protein
MNTANGDDMAVVNLLLAIEEQIRGLEVDYGLRLRIDTLQLANDVARRFWLGLTHEQLVHHGVIAAPRSPGGKGE